jgi:protocatechuate 3,4-dioxygenase beta subunit
VIQKLVFETNCKNMERKNFLRAFAVAAASGPMLIDACTKESSTSSTTSTTTKTSTTSTTTTDSGSCTVTPTETEGPYPYPGGELTNPLNRSAITESETGVPLLLTLNVVNTNNECAAVSGARVDIWHCNKDGYYSGYANQPGISGSLSYVGKTFLRGYQLADSDGVVKFTTIYPGWYGGRATHIHFEVYVNNVLEKTTQITFSETISDAVDVSTLYAGLGVNPIRNASDSVFGDSATDLANETIALTGSISAGYSGSYTIGLAL